MTRHLARVPDFAPRLRASTDASTDAWTDASTVTTLSRDEEVTELVVMEWGSAWPGHDESIGAEHANVHVIAQQDDEPASTLMVRVVRRLARLDEVVPVSARSAVISCSSRTDRATLASRALIARSILSSIARVGRGKLVLAGQDDPATNHALLALADELKDRVRSTAVSIAIQLSPSQAASWEQPAAAVV